MVSMLDRIYKYSVAAFILFWMLFLFIDYWQRHPMYANTLMNTTHWGLYLLLGGIGGGIGYVVFRLPQFRKYIRGITLFIFCLLVLVICAQYHLLTSAPSGMGSKQILVLFGLLIYTSFSTFLTIVVSYNIGDLLLRRLNLSLKKLNKILINIAIGIIGLVGVLFILGLFKLLYWFTVLPIFLIAIALDWRSAWAFCKQTLFTPLKISKKLNWVGLGSFLLFVLIINLNFFQSNVPFPRGFDSLSLYLNLPSLIHDYHGLVNGYQPYNWSIFMSLGFVLFQKIEVAMSLSFLGGVLSAIAIYKLSRDWLKLNTNYSLLSACLFYLIPSIGVQSFLELKVDLALLYILLCVVILLLHWIKLEVKKEEDQLISYRWGIDPYIALMGLLTGFAFGIKLTTLFTFFGILATIWYLIKGKIGFLALFCLSIFAILLIGIDRQSGLREYHLGASYVQWLMLLIGTGLAVWLIVKHPKEAIRGIRLSVIYGIFFILPFIPWLGKNYVESGGQLSVTTLLNGKSNAPSGSINTFVRNWNNSPLNNQ